MPTILIIQNDKLEGAGVIPGLLAGQYIDFITVEGETVNADDTGLHRYDGLIILGGAQGVYEQDIYPYLTQELALCMRYVKDKKPIMGICLGAQILATALGGHVHQNTQKELGWHDLELTPEGERDQLFTAYPKCSPAYHFHGDYIDLPPNSVNLAGSQLTQCQAFRYGSNVYGFQYHCEVDLPLVEIMCRGNADYMQANGSDAEHVIDESKTQLDAYQKQCEPLLLGWISLLGS